MASTPEPRPKKSPYDRWRPAEKVEWVPRDLSELRFARQFFLGKGYTRPKVAGFLEWIMSLDDPAVTLSPTSRSEYRKMLVTLSESSGNGGPTPSAHDVGSASLAAVVSTATVLLTFVAARRPELALAAAPIIHDPVNTQDYAPGDWSDGLELAA